MTELLRIGGLATAAAVYVETVRYYHCPGPRWLPDRAAIRSMAGAGHSVECSLHFNKT